jgi:hypothetical protein
MWFARQKHTYGRSSVRPPKEIGERSMNRIEEIRYSATNGQLGHLARFRRLGAISDLWHDEAA